MEKLQHTPVLKKEKETKYPAESKTKLPPLTTNLEGQSVPEKVTEVPLYSPQEYSVECCG